MFVPNALEQAGLEAGDADLVDRGAAGELFQKDPANAGGALASVGRARGIVAAPERIRGLMPDRYAVELRRVVHGDTLREAGAGRQGGPCSAR